MSEKGIVVASMIWLGLLIAGGRSNWLRKTRTFVIGVTHPGSAEAAALAAGTSHGDLAPGDWARFVVGYGGLWLVLAFMLDVPETRKLAAALAAAIALGASGLYLEDTLKAAGIATTPKPSTSSH